MKKILGKTKEKFWIEPPFMCDYGYNIYAGDNVFANYNCVFLDVGRIEIGADTLIGPIVTAAVYWDFDQELAPHQLIFQHRAGITPYTSTFIFAECYVFSKQLQPPIL